MDEKVFKSRFSHISDLLGAKYLFFDFELASMYNNVKELYQTFSLVKKRFDRKETARLSKTQTEYMELCRDSVKYPYTLYSFYCKDVSIAIVQHKKHYYVFCEGFTPSHNYKYYKDGNNVNLYSERDCLGDSVNDFVGILQEYLSEKFHRLSLGVPF